jgi:hypothetical protein
MRPSITGVVAVDDRGIDVAWLTKMDYCPESLNWKGEIT